MFHTFFLFFLRNSVNFYVCFSNSTKIIGKISTLGKIIQVLFYSLMFETCKCLDQYLSIDTGLVLWIGIKLNIGGHKQKKVGEHYEPKQSLSGSLGFLSNACNSSYADCLYIK